MLALFGCVGFVAADLSRGDTTTVRGLLVIPILMAIAAPFIRRAGRREKTFDLGGLLFCALAVKLLATFVRFIVVNDIYGGVADAGVYHNVGKILVQSFRDFDFAVDTGQRIPGTGTLRYLTGLVYLFTGVDKMTGFLVFSFFGFLGLYFFYRAFEIAVPQGDRHRYAKLIFFWPSLLFWPSSIGKESWMILTIGIAALGGAKMLQRQRGGFIIFGLGLVGTGLVRPHITLLLFLSMFVAYLLRPASQGGSSLGPITKAAGIVVMLSIGVLVMRQAQSFFDLEELNANSVDATLTNTSDRSGRGGSEFEPVRATNPFTFPAAAATVMFRPFPHEAGNSQAILSALEGLVLLVIFARSWRRFKGFHRTLRRWPYFAFCTAYLFLFVFAFSSIANFGILARQRVQVLPMIFAIAALPLAVDEVKKRRRRRFSYV